MKRGYNGGKNGSGVPQKIISLMPGHRKYIELFTGSGAILRMKKPAQSQIAVELNRDVLNALDCAHVPNLEHVHGDAFTFLHERVSEFTPNTLVYADPPYPRDCRADKVKRLYQFEMFENDSHCELLTLLKALPCMVMISSYENELYREMLAEWNLFTFYATDRAGRRRLEHVWYNFPTPTRLHDSRFWGKNDRARWALKKNVRSFIGKLKKMPLQKQWAIIDRINEYAETLK